MNLADQIIEHGPYEPYALVPNEVMRWIESDQLNALRAELMEGRQQRAAAETLTRFEVTGIGYGYDDHDVLISCGRCKSWDARLDAWATLADLAQRADEHSEECQ